METPMQRPRACFWELVHLSVNTCPFLCQEFMRMPAFGEGATGMSNGLQNLLSAGFQSPPIFCSPLIKQIQKLLHLKDLQENVSPNHKTIDVGEKLALNLLCHFWIVSPSSNSCDDVLSTFHSLLRRNFLFPLLATHLFNKKTVS